MTEELKERYMCNILKYSNIQYTKISNISYFFAVGRIVLSTVFYFFKFK